jgi:uncharacterized protein YkwD
VRVSQHAVEPCPQTVPSVSRARPGARPPRRVLPLALLAVALAFVSVLATMPSAHAATDLRGYLIGRINQVRVASGLPALAERAELDAFAQQHTQRMAAAGTLFHDAADPTNAMRWAQNVCYGDCPCSVEHAFELSASHIANILDRGFREVGVGLVQDRHGYWWITEQFAG